MYLPVILENRFWMTTTAEEILHHLIGTSSHYLQVDFASQVVVWDFFHQQYCFNIS